MRQTLATILPDFAVDHHANQYQPRVLTNDVLARRMTFNLMITSRQAFLTREALHNIASTMLG